MDVVGIYVVHLDKSAIPLCTAIPIGDGEPADRPMKLDRMRLCDTSNDEVNYTFLSTMVNRKPNLNYQISPCPPGDAPMFFSKEALRCQIDCDVEVTFFERQSYVDMKSRWPAYGFLIDDQWVGVLIRNITRPYFRRRIGWSIKVFGKAPLNSKEWTLRDGIGMKQDFAVVRPR